MPPSPSDDPKTKLTSGRSLVVPTSRGRRRGPGSARRHGSLGQARVDARIASMSLEGYGVDPMRTKTFFLVAAGALVSLSAAAHHSAAAHYEVEKTASISG